MATKPTMFEKTSVMRKKIKTFKATHEIRMNNTGNYHATCLQRDKTLDVLPKMKKHTPTNESPTIQLKPKKKFST